MADALTTLGTAMFDDVLMAKKAVGISWKVKGSLDHSDIFGIFWRLLSGVVRWHNEPGICVECCRMIYNCRYVTGSNMLIFPSQVNSEEQQSNQWATLTIMMWQRVPSWQSALEPLLVDIV